MDDFNKPTSEPDSGSDRIVGGYPPGSQLPYISPTPGQFPIIASTPFSHFLIKQTNPDTLTEKMVDEVIECGFNVGMEITSTNISNPGNFLKTVPTIRQNIALVPGGYLIMEYIYI